MSGAMLVFANTQGGVGRGVLITIHGRSRMTMDPRIPTMPGTEHVGLSPTRQTSLAPSAKRREVSASRMKGELHPTENACEADFLAYG